SFRDQADHAFLIVKRRSYNPERRSALERPGRSALDWNTYPPLTDKVTDHDGDENTETLTVRS
ncbi:unnamed protein product, partial [marine sediment metagenome]